MFYPLFQLKELPLPRQGHFLGKLPIWIRLVELNEISSWHIFSAYILSGERYFYQFNLGTINIFPQRWSHCGNCQVISLLSKWSAKSCSQRRIHQLFSADYCLKFSEIQVGWSMLLFFWPIKFIYSEKATKFCKVFP